MVRPNPTVKQGSVAWITISDPRGVNAKLRPVVIVSANEQVALGTFVTCVAVSGTFKTPLTSGLIPLPWNTKGTASTGFRKPSVAVCTWVVDVDLRELEATGKYIPAKTVTAIHKEIAKLRRKDT